MQWKNHKRFTQMHPIYWNEFFAWLPHRSEEGTLFWLEWGFRKMNREFLEDPSDGEWKYESYSYMTYGEYTTMF